MYRTYNSCIMQNSDCLYTLNTVGQDSVVLNLCSLFHNFDVYNERPVIVPDRDCGGQEGGICPAEGHLDRQVEKKQ